MLEMKSYYYGKTKEFRRQREDSVNLKLEY